MRLEPDAVGKHEPGRSDAELVQVLDILAADELLHELDLLEILTGVGVDQGLLLARESRHFAQKGFSARNDEARSIRHADAVVFPSVPLAEKSARLCKRIARAFA